jgi:hypothetical protein
MESYLFIHFTAIALVLLLCQASRQLDIFLQHVAGHLDKFAFWLTEPVFNRNAEKWSFAELHSFIDYKAVLAGSLAVKVNV